METSRDRHQHNRGLLLAGGIIGLAEAGFFGLVFSPLLFLALPIAIRSNFLMALMPVEVRPVSLPLNASFRTAKLSHGRPDPRV
jgi:hypothetical protein